MIVNAEIVKPEREYHSIKVSSGIVKLERNEDLFIRFVANSGKDILRIDIEQLSRSEIDSLIRKLENYRFHKYQR